MFDISEIFRNGGGLGSSSRLDRSRGEALDDPAPSWRYDVIWPTLPGFDDEFVKKIVAETLTFPISATSPIGRHAGASMVYFPDFTDVQGMSATFYLDQYHRALNYFMVWKALSNEPDGTYFESSYYKFDIQVDVFPYGDSESPATKLKLFGVWASEVNAIELSYENADRIKLDVTFSVDATSVEFTGGPESSSSSIESVLQTGQRILRTGRRGIREIKSLASLF